MNGKEFKKLSLKEILPLRAEVLRPGPPLESARFDGDHLPSTQHFGICDSNHVLGIISYYKASHPEHSPKYSYQLRGMAVSDLCQGQGIGRYLIQFSLPLIKTQGIEEVWCNARQMAVPFYEKQNFKIVSDVFEIEGVGPHFVMRRNLLNESKGLGSTVKS